MTQANSTLQTTSKELIGMSILHVANISQTFFPLFLILKKSVGIHPLVLHVKKWRTINDSPKITKPKDESKTNTAHVCFCSKVLLRAFRPPGKTLRLAPSSAVGQPRVPAVSELLVLGGLAWLGHRRNHWAWQLPGCLETQQAKLTWANNVFIK